MINAKLDHVKTLPEFYTEIRKQHEEAHGIDYCWQHDAMQRLMKSCDSYKELGTHQGASAAAACLTNPKSVTLVDIDMHRWRPFENLFNDYCKENNIRLTVKEMSSTDTKTLSPTDLLLIDSNHQPAHLIQELEVHKSTIKKYIVLHDTSRLFGRVDDRLYRVAESFCSGITPWRINFREKANVGYTILENTLNT
jgi:hypothetical protein